MTDTPMNTSPQTSREGSWVVGWETPVRGEGLGWLSMHTWKHSDRLQCLKAAMGDRLDLFCKTPEGKYRVRGQK